MRLLIQAAVGLYQKGNSFRDIFVRWQLGSPEDTVLRTEIKTGVIESVLRQEEAHQHGQSESESSPEGVDASGR